MPSPILRLHGHATRLLAAAVLAMSGATAWAQSDSAAEDESQAIPSVTESHPAQGVLTDAFREFQEGNGDVALNLLKAAASEHEDLPPAEVVFAHLCYGSNNADAGRRVLEIAAVKHADDPEVWNMLADLALRDGRNADAEVLFDKALVVVDDYNRNEQRRSRQMINAIAGLASVFQRREQWPLAEDHLREWIELDRENPAPWRRLAAVLFEQEEYATAEQTLINLRSFRPEEPIAGVSLGLMHEQAGNHAAAKKAIEKALEEGDDFATHIAVAQWALTSGENAILQNSAAKADELEPGSPTVAALLGMSERFAGRPEKAEAIFQRLLNDSPASFDATNGLALSLLEQDDQQKHRKGAELAQVLAKSNPDLKTPRGRAAAGTLAWAFHKLGQSAAAEQLVMSIVNSGDVSPETSYFAAEIVAANGNTELARLLLSAALKSRVAFAQRQQAEARLKRLGG